MIKAEAEAATVEVFASTSAVINRGFEGQGQGQGQGQKQGQGNKRPTVFPSLLPDILVPNNCSDKNFL